MDFNNSNKDGSRVEELEAPQSTEAADMPSASGSGYPTALPKPKLHQFGYVKWQWSPATQQISRVPQVTLLFWVVKCLCTALGETMADQMNVSFGEDDKSQGKALAVYGMMLFFFLCLQFWLRAYFAPVYWACVLLISICGTLITDIMVDINGIVTNTTTAIFASLLGATFVVWYVVERTLNIHSIFSARREAFYWLVVLFTFVLGTSTGDQMGESDALGYWRVLCIVLGVIIGDYFIFVILSITFKEKLPSWVGILCFWIAYVLTRPLGASVGDLLTASKGNEYTSDSCMWPGASEDDTGCGDGDVFCITPYGGNLSFSCNTCAPPPAPHPPHPPPHPHPSPPHPHPPPVQLGRLLLQAADYVPADSGPPGCYDICASNWTAAFCPDGPYPNPCDSGVSTCYTPPPCPSCWGLDALVATNIAFACAVFVLVAYLTWSGVDKISPPGKEEPLTFWERLVLLLGLRLPKKAHAARDKEAVALEEGSGDRGTAVAH